MASAQEYAQWIVDNQDKQGSEEFDTVARAYEAAKTQMTAEPKEASVSIMPQAISVGQQLAAGVPEAVGAIAPTVKQGAQWLANRPLTTTLADVAGIAHSGIPLGSTLGAAKNAIMGGGPSLADTYASVKNLIKGGGSALTTGARGVGGAIVSGLTAPESLLAMPYQGAAYEQEQIRQNPNAPEYANNPYAQMYRGEAPTQGAAGAANRRQAIAGQQYGGLSQQEQDILQQDAITKQIRLKAAQKALQPIAPQPLQ